MQLLTKHASELRKEVNRPTPSIPSGFSRIDNLVGGCPLGQVIVVGGRSSMGKSAFTIDLALNAANKNHPVLFLSMEMSAHTVFKRMMSSVSLVPIKNFGSTDETEEGRMSDAEAILTKMKIMVDDCTDLTVSGILKKVDWFSTQCNEPFLVVVDYLDLIQSDERQRSRTYEIEDIMKALQREMKNRPCCMILACQLNRDTEKRDNPWPRLADLKSSGSIEQSADQVWLLFRDDYYKMAEGNIDQDMTGEAKLIIAKNRHGPVGVVELAFIPDIVSFRDVMGGSLDVWRGSSAPPF